MKDHTRLYQQKYTNAAKKIGLEYKIISPLIYEIYNKRKSIMFFQATCGANDSVAYFISNRKNITHEFLKKYKLPVFPQYVVTDKSINQILKLAKIIKYPVVLKPIDGHGGEGVIANIRNNFELKKDFNNLRKNYKSILLEKHYFGCDHRILIARNKVLAVTQRFPARVQGDGNKNIKQLIYAKNKRLLFPIVLEKEILDKLKSQKLSLKSVPKNKQIVYLRNRSNSHLGGTTYNIDIKKVHPDYIKACKKAMKELNLKLAGFDFMTTDITKSYKKTHGAITEINCNPGISMQARSATNPINDIAEQVLKELFEIK